MKNFKSLMIAALAVLASTALTSCSDDDNGGPGSKADLVGRWESVHEKGWEKEDGEFTYEWDQPDNSLRWDLYADGTCVTWEKSSGSTSWTYPNYGTYTYKGGNLVIKYDDDEYDENDGGKVIKLTDTELEVESSYSEREDGVKYEGYICITFKKTGTLDE